MKTGKVYCYHWDIKKEPVASAECDKIYAWCLDAATNPYLLRFEDKKTLFHLDLPLEVGGVKIDWKYHYPKIVDFILYRIKKHRMEDKRCARLASYSFGYRKTLYFYGEPPHPILTLYFNNAASMYVVKSFFDRPVAVKDVGNKSMITTKYGKQFPGYPMAKYECLETYINIVRRMLSRVNLAFCQWFSFKGRRMTGEDKISYLENEYLIKDSIIPISDEESREWRISPGVFTFDIETKPIDCKGFARKELYGHTVFSISCMYTRYNSTKRRVVNMIIAKEAACNEGEEVRCYPNEKALLKDFFKLIAETNPEIITGYNIYGFDNEYLWYRVRHNKVEIDSRVSRLLDVDVVYDENNWQSKGYGHNEIKQIVMSGRIDIDVIFHVKKNYKLPQNTLDTAAKVILRRGKYELPYKVMFEHHDFYINTHYKHDCANLLEINPKDLSSDLLEAQKKLNTIVKYNAVDTILTYDIFEKIGLFTTNMEMSNIVGVNIQDILNRGQQSRGVSTIYNECQPHGIILNKAPFDSNLKFIGGKVFEVKKVGMWKHVACIDFASLYPSVIVSLNLCYSTLIPLSRWDEVPEGKYNAVRWTEPISGITHEYRYVKAELREGILPALLKKLLNSRSDIKKAMASEKNPMLLSILDKKQLAVKVCANSIYGLTGISEEMGKLPLRPLSCSVTAAGREFITMAEEYVEEKYGGTIVYGDTDSIMFQLPNVKTGQECIEMGIKLAKEITKLYPGIIRFEFEKAGYLLTITKKKYIYWKYNPYAKLKDGSPNPEYGKLMDLNDPASMELRGNVLVRRDNCEWYKKIYRDLLFNILKEQNISKAYKELSEEIIKMMQGGIDAHDFVIYSGMGSNYKNKTFKLAMFRDGLRKRGRYIAPGTRFGYVVIKIPDVIGVDGKYKKKYLGDKMRLIEEYDEAIERGEKMEIDYEYYLHLISKKNIDQLWESGYSNITSPITDRLRYKKYKNTVCAAERFDETGVIELFRVDTDNHIKLYEKTKDFLKDKRIKTHCHLRQLIKGFAEMRKKYLGTDVFDYDLGKITLSMYRAFTKKTVVMEDVIKKMAVMIFN